MAELRFEWDHRKSSLNRHKHGITFHEAETVFLDDNALLIDDPDRSEREERFVILGFSVQLRVLVVCHCYRRGGDVVRNISARRANPAERRLYTQRRKE
jgi:uncharacterized DUF497 family protein